MSPTSTTLPLVPGAHQDPADLYGILLALLVIAVSLFAVRFIFRKR